MNFYSGSSTFATRRVAVYCRAAVLMGITFGAACLCVAAEPTAQTKTLQVGEACLVPTTGSNIVVATEGIIRVLPAGPGKAVVSGVKEGRTDMLVLHDDGQVTERYSMVVAQKPLQTEKETFAASLEDFRDVIKKMVGDTQVQFEVVVGPRISFEDTNLVSRPHPVLFMHGEAKDEIEADTLRSVASRFYGKGDFGNTTQQVAPQGYATGMTTTNNVTVRSLSNDPSIVDQITVRAHHQIRIRVQVAEVNIKAAKNKGLTYSSSLTYGVAQSMMPLSQLNFKSATSIGALIPAGSSDSTPFQATLQLLLDDNEARLLSEPTMLTKSGEEASFLAGGQLLQQVSAGLGSTSLQVVPFGVHMTIKPKIDRAEHIDTEVFAEVSEAPTSVNNVGTTITTRNSSAKVRLEDHQTLVLSGLLQNNFNNEIRKMPWLGEVPVLGALFRSKAWQSGQTELLFFVTPEIIRDVKQDTERGAVTPAMKQWWNVDMHKDILPDPKSHAGPDNDVHDLLGLPRDRMKDREDSKSAPVLLDTAPARGTGQ